MALATLSIDLEARLANLQAGLDKAGQLTAKAVGQIQAKLEGLQAVASGVGSALAAAISVAGLVQIGRATVDGLDKLNDLADATGSTVEKMSALEDIGARTGTSVDTVSDAVLKLNKVLSEATPGSQAEASLKAIGLSAADLRRLDPADALLAVSRGLAEYTNEGDKARLVQDLLGKSTERIAPFLKDMADKGELNAKVTAEQARQAELFNQQLFQMQKNTVDLARSIASDALPELNKMLLLLAEFRKGPGLLSAAAEAFKGNAFASAEEGLVAYNAKIKDVDADLTRLAKLENDSRASVAASATREIEKLKEKRAQLEAFATAYRNVATAATSAVAGDPLNPEGGLPTKRVGSFKIDTKAQAEAEAADKAYRALIQSLTKRGELAQAELDNNGKLDAADTFRIEQLDKLINGEHRYSAAKIAAGRADIERVAALLTEIDTRAKLRAIVEAALHAEQSLAEAAEQGALALNEENRALLDQLATYGLTATEVDSLNIKRLEQRRAGLEAEIVIKRLTGAGAAEVLGLQEQSAQLERQIELRSRLNDQMRREIKDPLAEAQRIQDQDPTAGANRALQDYRNQLRDAGIATEQAIGQGFATLEDSLTSSLAKGKFNISSFVDYALQELIRLQVVKPLLSSVFGGGSVLSGLFGSQGGGGAGISNVNAGVEMFKNATPLAVGLDYVPTDNFFARLHRGERVQTAAEARKADSQTSAPSMQVVNNFNGDVSANTMRALDARLALFEARMNRRAR